MTITITIPIDVQRASPNRRINWRERARVNREHRLAAQIHWRLAGRPVLRPPVRVSLILRRGRRLDTQNLWACAKPLLDGLLCARANNGDGIVPDDSPRYVRLGDSRQDCGRKWRGREELTVIVEEIEKEEEEA